MADPGTENLTWSKLELLVLELLQPQRQYLLRLQQQHELSQLVDARCVGR